MNIREIVTSDDAPAAIGPYSQAVRSQGLVFCSGQVPLDPTTGEIDGKTAAEQTERCLRNLAAVAKAADAELAEALRLTIFLTSLDNFASVNDAYADWFGEKPPARVTIGVAELPKGALVEIDAILPVA